ncbi:SET domain-containing protein SmydA-8, isoform A, partial [Frankliniella fusca]
VRSNTMLPGDADVFAELVRAEARGGACRLAVDEALGRHLVAARPIPAGEVFLRCRPLVAGPKATTAADAVCLGCCRPLGPAGPARHPCPGCGWPLCSAACARAPAHRVECAVLAAAPEDARPPGPVGDPSAPAASPAAHWYAGVLPLRMLLLRGPGARAVRALQSHLGDRLRDSAAYRDQQGLQRRAAAFVARVLGVPEDDALRMAAVLDTNAFDVGREGVEARALFGSVSMLAHDCQASARCAMLGELKLGVLAQRDIAPGEVVSISYYADSLQGPLRRRRHLRATKCFDCACARCADPTDLGLYLDSIRCIRCRQRTAASADEKALLVATAPLDSAADWRCPRCGFTLSAEQMQMGHRRLRAQLDALDGADGEDAVRVEAFLAEHLGPDGLLHATSAHVLRAKNDLLAGAYAFIPGCSTPLTAVSDARLQRAVAMCVDLLEVVGVLEPGLSVLRGCLLLRLLGLLLERARRSTTAAAAAAPTEDVHLARQLFREAQVIFMDLETRTELRKREIMMERWIGENVVAVGSQHQEGR